MGARKSVVGPELQVRGGAADLSILRGLAETYKRQAQHEDMRAEIQPAQSSSYTLGPSYRQGIQRLVELAAAQRPAIMCGEPMPWRCHRLLIANTLTAQGWTVWHLIGDAPPRRHELGRWGAAPTIGANEQVTYPAS